MGIAALGSWSRTLLAANPRMRVIVDNDFGGDPDGLFQLAYFSLSQSVSIPLIVGSQYRDFGEADLVPDKAAASVAKANELLSVITPRNTVPLVAGSAHPLTSIDDFGRSAATDAIANEALRGEQLQPLYYSAGGSLTEIARAWMAYPAIGQRLKLVWIGGAEHPDLAEAPPGPYESEYNFSLDPLAAEIIFNRSDIEIWQVPRNAFRQMLIGWGELEDLGLSAPLGRFLHAQTAAAHTRLSANLPSFIFNEGESLMLGDTALVALTALQSAFQPDTASSAYTVRPTPTLLPDGTYRPNPAGRPMRVYNMIDTRLTFADMMSRIRAHDRRIAASAL